MTTSLANRPTSTVGDLDGGCPAGLIAEPRGGTTYVVFNDPP